jgi:1-acyl-sn-glycerol-3-phosphate acyltransferase
MGKRKILYELLRPIISSGLRLFHNEFYVFGYENLKGSHLPTIVVANHQNALLDPILCSTVFYEQLHWLTRSDVFKPGFIAWILKNINMQPVYRERDNVDGMRERNEIIFEECYKRLNQGAWISLFPEGTHRGKKALIRPLKKGASRLIVGTFEKNPELNQIRIIPVGLEYEQLEGRDGNILVRIGEPILLTKEDYNTANKAIWNNELTNEITEHISSCMLDVPVEFDEHYDAIMLLQDLFVNIHNHLSWGEANVEFQKFVHSGKLNEKDLIPQLEQLRELTRDLHIEEREWRLERKLSWNRISLQLMLLPLVLSGIVIYSPISILTEQFVSKKVKDPLFKNSIRIAFKTFLGSLYTLFLGGILSFIFSFNFFGALGTLLLLGILGVRGKMFWKTWFELRKFKSKINKNKEKLTSYLNHRNCVIQTIKKTLNETN